ncbi:hypothetical protein KCU61_g314, partial [Aureobasidium melanogenum]
MTTKGVHDWKNEGMYPARLKLALFRSTQAFLCSHAKLRIPTYGEMRCLASAWDTHAQSDIEHSSQIVSSAGVREDDHTKNIDPRHVVESVNRLLRPCSAEGNELGQCMGFVLVSADHMLKRSTNHALLHISAPLLQATP